MKSRLTVLLLTIMVSTIALTSAPVPMTATVEAAGPDCGVVRSVCNDIWWGGMYPLCMDTVGVWSVCQLQSHAGYGSCVIDAGCPLHD